MKFNRFLTMGWALLLIILFLLSTVAQPVTVDKDQTNQLTDSAFVIETGLQRLLVKKIDLSLIKKIQITGALAISGDQVFIHLNENNTNKEKIYIYDFEKIKKYNTDKLKVPMNYSELLESSFPKLENFNLSRFRVSGLFIENKKDGLKTLFASHYKYEPDLNSISFNVSRTTLKFISDTVTVESGWKTIFKAEPCIVPQEGLPLSDPFPGHMSGGKMIEYDDKTLLLSVGNFNIGFNESDYLTTLPSDSSSSFGKFLLIDKETGNHSIFAIGTRNAQGLYKEVDGTIWATEHGPQGGDELNIIEKGKNYGWPKVTYGIQYGNVPWGLSKEQGRHDHYTKPVFAWMPSIAPTSIIKINFGKFELWKDDFLVASLKNQSLHRLRIEGKKVVYDEPIHIGERIRGLSTLSDGKIIILTEQGSILIIDNGGAVYQNENVQVERKKTNLERYNQILLEDLNDENSTVRYNSEAIFEKKCSSCHSINNVNKIGPHLNNLFGRSVGELEDFNYSTDLTSANISWTPELLETFLLSPRKLFKNTNMMQVSLTETEVDSIISFIGKTQK